MQHYSVERITCIDQVAGVTAKYILNVCDAGLCVSSCSIGVTDGVRRYEYPHILQQGVSIYPHPLFVLSMGVSDHLVKARYMHSSDNVP